jgi:hypothetical protein
MIRPRLASAALLVVLVATSCGRGEAAACGPAMSVPPESPLMAAAPPGMDDADRALSRTVALGDAQVRGLVGGQEVRVRSVVPWSGDSGAPVGGLVWLLFDAPIDLPAGLPRVQMFDPPLASGRPYLKEASTTTARCVTDLHVLVDVTTREVVQISTGITGEVTNPPGFHRPPGGED